jgi:hypothetical protein
MGAADAQGAQVVRWEIPAVDARVAAEVSDPARATDAPEGSLDEPMTTNARAASAGDEVAARDAAPGAADLAAREGAPVGGGEQE